MQQRHGRKGHLPPFHLKQLICLILNKIKELRYESWTRKNIAIKDIIGGNWPYLNMDFGTRLLSKPV